MQKRNNIIIYRFPWVGRNLFNKLEKYPLLESLYLLPGILLSSFFNTSLEKFLRTRKLKLSNSLFARWRKVAYTAFLPHQINLKLLRI